MIQLVEAAKAHYAATGYPPSYKELGHRLGIRASATDELVKRCEKLGILTVVRKKGERTQIRLDNRLREFSTGALATELLARKQISGRPLTAAPANSSLPGNKPEEPRAVLAA